MLNALKRLAVPLNTQSKLLLRKPFIFFHYAPVVCFDYIYILTVLSIIVAICQPQL